MRSLLLMLASLASLSQAATSVRTLDPGTLRIFIEEHKTVMVNYESPYCGHCRVLAPEYERAAEFLEQHEIYLGKIDCMEYSDFCSDAAIIAYPTLRVHQGSADTFTIYQGKRTAEDLISHMTNGTYPTETSTSMTTTSTVAYSRPTRSPLPNPSPNPTASTSVFLSEKGDYAVIKLEIPGLPYITPKTYEVADVSSSVLLKFNISDNGYHLMLNGQNLALQIPDPSIPARIGAAQIRLEDSINIFGQLDSSESNIPTHESLDLAELDYELSAHNRDDPNIRYYNYFPKIQLNLIGASIVDRAQRQDFLLDSLDQLSVEMVLYDRNGPSSSDSPDRFYAISEIELRNRPSDYRVPRPDDRGCNLWSWRCADIQDPPWYQYVWRQNFDESGRVGCLRRQMLIKWTYVRTKFLAMSSFLSFASLTVFACFAIAIKTRTQRREHRQATKNEKASGR